MEGMCTKHNALVRSIDAVYIGRGQAVHVSCPRQCDVGLGFLIYFFDKIVTKSGHATNTQSNTCTFKYTLNKKHSNKQTRVAASQANIQCWHNLAHYY